MNPARYMATRRARQCFAEGDSEPQGMPPASSTPATATEPVTADAAAWFYCRYTRNLMQTDLAMPTSDADDTLPRLFGGDEDKDQEDTDEWDIDAFLEKFFIDDDDPPPLCPRAKDYTDRDGPEAVDACSIRAMDRLEHHGYANANARVSASAHGYTNGFANGYANGYPNGYPNGYANNRDIGIPIRNGFDIDIDDEIGRDSSRQDLYIQWGQPSVRPVLLLPPLAPDTSPSLPSFSVDRVPEVESPWKQQGLAIGDEVHLDSHDDDDDDDRPEQLLAETHRAVAVDESFTIEAFIATSDRREQERKALEDDEEEEKSFARNILGVAKNATGYIGNLFKVSPTGLC